MLPKDEFASRFEQLPDLLHHSLWIPYRAQNLDTKHGIHTAFGDPLLPQNIAVFNARNNELVLVVQAVLLHLGMYAVLVAGVGLDAVDLVDARRVETVDLIAWSRA